MSITYEQRDGQGSLFINEKKTSDKQPDYQGNVMINGKKMQIAGWKKQSKSGSTFLSIQISEPREATTAAAKPAFDDKLPF
jgi:uncharacterized protein (DUF736 family)